MFSKYVLSKTINKTLGIINEIHYNIVLCKTIINNICYLINLVSSTKKLNNIDFNCCLDQLDLMFKLNVINGFLMDLSNKHPNAQQTDQIPKTLNDYYEIIPNSDSEKPNINLNEDMQMLTYIHLDQDNCEHVDGLSIGLNYLSQTVNEINNQIVTINNKIEYDNTKYFKYFRQTDLTNDIKQLITKHEVLMNRFDLIVKVYS